MRLDIHIHTVHSACSQLNADQLCRAFTKRGVPMITVTDHGNVKAFDELLKVCPELVLVYGVEVTTKEGDFLVFSTDREYVSGLEVYQETVSALRRDDHTAVLWAHPRVEHKQNMDWTRKENIDRETSYVAEHIDGMEIFNGTILRLVSGGVIGRDYYRNLRDLAATYDLCLTGGSDAHMPHQIFTAWTEFDHEVYTAEDFIAAIKKGAVQPGYDEEFYNLQADLTK